MNTVENNIAVRELDRKIVEIEPNNNPLGEAVAQFVIAFNDAGNTETSPLKQAGVVLKAYRVENDAQYGDHIKIQGYHTLGEQAGGFGTREVIIHTAPKGITQHTVRFVDFKRDDEIKQYHFGRVGELVQVAISYILTGELGD